MFTFLQRQSTSEPGHSQNKVGFHIFVLGWLFELFLNMQENQTPEVNKVGLKLPPFWDKHPVLWFANIEAQFVVSGITQDTTKYYFVISALTSDVLSYVSDIVLTPPPNDKYETLKSRLIAEFSDSDQRRIKAVLSELSLGDDKPSHLLRKMRELAGKTVGEDFLKTLWLQRLSNQVQVILSVSEDNLDKLAIMADKIQETANINIAEVQSQNNPISDVSELRLQIAELTKQVERLSRGRERQGRDFTPSRRRSKTPQKYEQCWYHFKFGEAAKRCKPPCRFQKQGN